MKIPIKEKAARVLRHANNHQEPKQLVKKQAKATTKEVYACIQRSINLLPCVLNKKRFFRTSLITKTITSLTIQAEKQPHKIYEKVAQHLGYCFPQQSVLVQVPACSWLQLPANVHPGKQKLMALGSLPLLWEGWPELTAPGSHQDQP